MTAAKLRLEFEQTVEGLFAGALGAKQDLELFHKLREGGLDLSHKLQPAYPAEDFYRWVKIAAKHLHPQLPEQDALAKIGEAAVQKGLDATVLGRALLLLMRTLGIRRSLLRIGRSFKNGNNYVEAAARELSPTAIEVSFNTVMGAPGYFRGVLESGTKLMGGQDVRVTEIAGEGEARTFRVEWRP